MKLITFLPKMSGLLAVGTDEIFPGPRPGLPRGGSLGAVLRYVFAAYELCSTELLARWRRLSSVRSLVTASSKVGSISRLYNWLRITSNSGRRLKRS